MRVVHHRHTEGLFPRATWVWLLERACFRLDTATRPGDDGEPDKIFVAVRK